MRGLWAVVPVLALAAACTSSDGGSKSSDPPTPSVPATSTSRTPTSTPPTSPTRPAAPTVPTDVPTSGPNTKAGEKPPVMPVAATKHNPAGAKAFAEFYMRAFDWGYATMSGAYIRHYAAPGCAICSSIANGIDNARTQGHRYVGGRATIIGARPGKSGALSSQIVRIDTTSFEEVTNKGAFVTGDPAYKNQDWAINLRWAGTGWSVARVAVIQ